MALETGSFISDLNSSNPQSSDSVSQADDHIRLIKSTVKATFPNVTGAVTKTHSQINDLLEKSGGTMTGALTLSGAPSSDLHAATKAYADSLVTSTVSTSRTISTGTGLTGGGDLSANRTLSISSGGVGTTQLADSGVTTAKIADGAVTPAKMSQKLTAATAQGTTSGNTKDFTDIPSWVQRITIQFLAVSLNAAGIIRVQLGDSGGLEATGYGGTSALVGFHSYSITNGYGIDVNSNSLFFSGQMIIEKTTGNYWISSHTLGAGGGYVVLGGAYKELSGTLDRLQIAATDTAGATSGSISFDAGAVNIFYE
jgi:hypothetical protein